MINENKVRLMTRLALYEKNQLKDDEKAENYFHGDYLSKQFLGTFVCGTIAFVIIFLTYGAYNFEQMMLDIYSMDVMGFVRNVLFIYLVFMAVLLSITGLVYSIRYRRASKGIHRYYLALKKLQSDYREDRA